MTVEFKERVGLTLSPAEQAELIRTHYRLQHGALITDLQEDGDWLQVFSDLSPVPMWNHAAWVGKPGVGRQERLQSLDWLRPSRRPVAYWVEQSDAGGEADERVAGSNFERCDQESWMFYSRSAPPPIAPLQDLEICWVQTEKQLGDFLQVFSAAFGAQASKFQNVFRLQSADEPGRRTQHFIGYAQGEAVCGASLISLNGLACIYNVGTPPGARKRGFAAQLMVHLVGESIRAGFQRLFLQAERGSGAERLYARLGFEIGFVRTGFRLADWSPGSGQRGGGSVATQPSLPTAFLHALYRDNPPDLGERSWQSVPFPPGLKSAVSQCASQLKLGAETIWTVGWAALLSRYSAESEIQFGVVRAGPDRATNDVIVHVEMAAQRRVSDCLQEVQGLLGAEPSDLPEGGAARPFKELESTLRFDSASEPALAGKPTDCALECRLSSRDEGTLELSYDLRKFQPAVVLRLAHSYFALVRSLGSDPNLTVAALEILGPGERQRLLERWGQLPVAPREYVPVSRLIERAAGQSPQALALLLAGQADHALTYAALNSRANQLAHFLTEVGVGPEKVVAVYLERSLEMIVALLAVFKAGGVCLPLDPSYPGERLEFILSDAAVWAVITHGNSAGTLPDCGAIQVRLDGDADRIRAQPSSNLSRSNEPEDSAYVIYTSGSTGKPKGVIIPHRALAWHCMETCESYGLKPADRVLQFNSLSFDAALEQIVPALMSGAALVLRGPAVWTVREFGERLAQAGLTVVDLPTAYWHQLLREWTDNRERMPAPLPRLMIVGGEAMPVGALALWRNLPLSSVRLLNAYGPTETTITATAFEITSRFLARNGGRGVPIGRPRGLRTIYLLDSFGRPVPEGVPGELYIGGPLLARGYLKRPELTAERFVQNPFQNESNERLYRTGDVGRFLASGDIEFLGRADQQVKVRGYRVELGEIEAALLRHPDLRESAVVLREESGRAALGAYFVCKNGQCPSAQELRQFLKQSLPEYMVPASFLALESMPLLPGGKVDRRRLAQLAPGQADQSGTGPRDPIELRLQLLFERILQRTGIGVDVSFFELGGDSLQALELIVEMERMMGQSLPLETLYQTSSIEALARLVSSHQPEATQSSLVQLQVGSTRPPLFLVHTTPGDILGYGNLIYHLDPEQPCYGFQSVGLLQSEHSHSRIEEMAAHYTALLRAAQPTGPYYLAGWCYGGLVAVEMAQRLLAENQTVAFLGLLETVAPAPTLKVYRYYLHRLRCFLRMSPAGWFCYFRSKVNYYRDVRLANKMRFRRLEATAAPDAHSLAEHNRRLAKLEHVYNLNLTALDHYRPRPYPGRVTLFNAEIVDRGVIPDPLYAWPGLAAEIEVHPVPGDHDTMLTEPNVAILARTLEECLTRAQAGASQTLLEGTGSKTYGCLAQTRV